MKNQYYYLALSLFSLLMMGCSNDSAMDTPESTRMVPVGIRQVSVSGSAAITRASTTITDGQIGVFRTTANGYPAQNNVPYSYDAASGGWSATTTDNAILVDHRNATLLSYNPNITSLAAGTSTDCDVLVPPQPVASGLTITLTIDGLNRAVTIPAAQFTSNALAAGQQYTIKLTIMDTAVIFDGNVAITDYTTDGTTIKNDTPKEV